MAGASSMSNDAGSGLYSSLLEAAVRLAAQGHHHHFRKRTPSEEQCSGDGGPLPEPCVPYITHLMGAALILARLGARDEVVAAALLHDYLEDVPDPDGRETIRCTVGEEVLGLVLEVTENKRGALRAVDTWEVRKREQVSKIVTMSRDAVRIKAADLLHNLTALVVDLETAASRECVWERFNAEPDRQLWYFRSVLEAVRGRLGTHPLVGQLELVVAQLVNLMPE